MKGGIGWNLRSSSVKRYISDVPVSRNWYKTVSKVYQYKYIWDFRVVVLNRSNSTNTQPIWKWLYPTGAWESKICSFYNVLIFILHF